MFSPGIRLGRASTSCQNIYLETRTNDVPLLFKRQDFSKTDLASALPNS